MKGFLFFVLYSLLQCRCLQETLLACVKNRIEVISTPVPRTDLQTEYFKYSEDEVQGFMSVTEIKPNTRHRKTEVLQRFLFVTWQSVECRVEE